MESSKEKKLENAKWPPKWISYLGCIKGCLDYLKPSFQKGRFLYAIYSQGKP